MTSTAAVRHYILRGHEPVPEPDLSAWGLWMDDFQARRVARWGRSQAVGNHPQFQATAVEVSTVFLGADHNWAHDGSRPILFGTMVFGGALDGYQWRDCTWDEAVARHTAVVAEVLAAEGWE